MHSRMKHVEIDFHFVRDKVQTGQLLVRHLSTVDQLADIFTKGLGIPRFLSLKAKLTVHPDPLRLRGRVSDKDPNQILDKIKCNNIDIAANNPPPTSSQQTQQS